MNRTEFGLTWDDALPGLAQARSQLDPSLFDALTRYFEDCVETGGFLRAVLENDLGGAVARMHPALPDDILVVLSKLLCAYAPAEAWGSPERVAAWLARRQEKT